MRYSLIALGAALLLSGCSSSASPSTSTAGETVSSPTSSATETTTAPTPSPERPGPLPSASAEPTAEPSVDFMGQPLAGLPDCDWSDKNLWFDQYSSMISEGEKAGLWNNSFAVVNATGQNCVVRSAPTLTLIDRSGKAMWPANPQTQPDDDLPWVLRDKIALRLYYYAPDPDTLCPRTAKQIETARFTFKDGTIVDYPMRGSKYLMLTCPQNQTQPDVAVHMNLAQ